MNANEGMEIENNAANLIGMWHMDGSLGSISNGATVPDSQTNVAANNGTASNVDTSGMSYAAGKFDNAISFDGTDDYIDVANESNFDFERTDAFSLEAWIYPASSASGNDTIIGKHDGNPNYRGYILYRNDTDNLYFILRNDNGSGNKIDILSTNNMVTTGSWHHVVVTYDGSSTGAGVLMYVDGTLQTKNIVTDNLTGTILNDLNLHIGDRNDSTTHRFEGLIDEVAVWNTELNAAMIQAQYERGLAMDTTTNNNDGQILGPISTTGNTNLNEALLFDGVDDYVDIGDLTGTEGNNALTVEAWIYPNDISATHYIAGKYGPSGTPFYADRSWALLLDSSGHIDFDIINAAGDTRYRALTTDTISTGQYYHIVGVFEDNVSLKIYINGSEASGYSTQETPPLSTTVRANNTNAQIGKYTGGGNYFNGIIDEVAIWNTVLSAATVAQHGSPASYPTDNPTAVNISGQSYSTLTSFTETLGAGNVGTVKYQISNNGANWYYYNGANWIAATGYAQSNTAAEVNTNIASFVADVGTGTFYLKAFLNSDGTQAVELDQIDLGYIPGSGGGPLKGAIMIVD